MAAWQRILLFIGGMLCIAGGIKFDGVLPDVVPPKPDDVLPDDPNADGVKRVLIVYESDDRGDYPQSQSLIFSSTDFREWLKSKVSVSSDGNLQFRIYDKDADMSTVPDEWRAAMAVERESLPWIIVSNGKSYYAGKLPETIAETQALIERYLK